MTAIVESLNTRQLEIKQHIQKYKLLFLALVLLAPAKLTPQSLIEFANPSARAAGLGNALTAAIHDPAAAFWNPASLGLIKDAQFRASASDPFSLSFLGLSYFFPNVGSLAFALTEFPSPRLSPDSLNSENHYLRRVIFGFGREVTRYFYAGGAVNFNRFSGESAFDSNLSFGLYAFPFSKSSELNALRINESKWFNNVILPQKFALALTVQDIPIGPSELRAYGDVSAFYRLLNSGTTLFSSFRFDDEMFLPRFGVAVPIRGFLNVVGGIEDFDFDRTALGASFLSRHYSIDVTYSFEKQTILADFAVRLGKSPSMRARDARAKGVRLYRNKMPRRALKSLQNALSFVPNDSLSIALMARINERLNLTTQKIDNLFVEAAGYEEKGWYIGAALNYQKIISLDRENPEAPRRLTAIQLKVDQNIEDLLATAEYSLSRDSLKDAETAISYVLELDKSHVAGNTVRLKLNERYREESRKHYERGVGFFQQKKYRQAAENFELAVNYDTDNLAAKEYFEKASKEAEDQAQRTKKMLQWADDHIRRAEYIDADNMLVGALEADPDLYQAKQKRKAIERKLAREVQSLVDSGRRLLERSDFERAKQRFEQLKKYPPRRDLASNLLRRVARAKAAFVNAIYVRGLNQFNAGNWTAAIAHFDSILIDDKSYKDVHSRKEDALNNLDVESRYRNADRAFIAGNYLLALEYYRDICNRAPESTRCHQRIAECNRILTIQVEQFFNTGVTEYTEGRYERAIALFDRILEIDSQHSQAQDYRERAIRDKAARDKLLGLIDSE